MKEPGMGLAYQSGFGNAFASEALAGALPAGQNSPQQAPFGLYAEQFSGTAFTAPRHLNRRTWMYRIRPSAQQGPWRPMPAGLWGGAPFPGAAVPPDPLRWNPFPMPAYPTDFLAGLATVAANGDPARQEGASVLVYAANTSMGDTFLACADGELLLLPQQGRLSLRTELGNLDVTPGEMALIPRGLRFQVDLPDGASRGYVCENHGAPFRLPELGPIGANGLANPHDFLAPVAAFEDKSVACRLVAKYQGACWETELAHSPLDVVAWRGNLAPCKYDLRRFNALGSISFDHPDPSIFTVLTSPSESQGTANADFVLFPPRWMVAEHTFRPPWFHRNVMSECMGLIEGAYDAKAEGFLPGGLSLHNALTGHGPDAATFGKASAAELKPRYLGDTLAFMIETRWALRPSRFALDSHALQKDYAACWRDLPKRFPGGA
jgi:homogentisate 1,2-dioxygenase